MKLSWLPVTIVDAGNFILTISDQHNTQELFLFIVVRILFWFPITNIDDKKFF